VVTDDRVLSRNPSGVSQALFHTLVTPETRLAEELFGIVNRQWLAARKR
jgi:hypothetical protein